jgi:peptidoglycan-N-acetylglucosamine deacetylase
MRSPLHVVLLVVTTLLLPTALPAAALLIFDSNSTASATDCEGISQALDEVGMMHSVLDTSSYDLGVPQLANHRVAVACHLDLDAAQAQLLDDWVAIGGNLLATGRSAQGLEAALGLDSVVEMAPQGAREMRFFQSHPVTTGSWWDGVITGPDMPADERPSLIRHWYFTDNWPAFAAIPGQAILLARWNAPSDDWDDATGAPALVSHHHEQGRTVYSGALPGTYADWDWPRAWRTLIVSAIEWLSWQEPLVSLGFWPDGHRGAFSWTGDTEMPAMETAVPALLDLFAGHGLERFGTFYMVGQAGGAAGTVGAVEYPHVAQAIVAAGSELGGHGDIHDEFLGQPYAEQHQRLENMQGILDPFVSPEAISGFRAPYLSQDATTWQALADLGFGHDAGDADVWSQTSLPHPSGDILQLPPTMPMDWHLLEVHDLPAATAQAIWLDKFDYVMSRRGLFSWLHHPWVIEPHLDIVDQVLAQVIDRGDVWLARQNDIAAWWLQRDLIEVERPGPTTPGRVAVKVRNTGTSEVTGASIWIRRPDGNQEVWSARTGGQSLDLIERWHGGTRFLVAVLPALGPGEECRLEVITEPVVHSDRFEQR